MLIQAVVDRISSGLAVVLSEDIKKEFHIKDTTLKEGDWLMLKIIDDEVQTYHKDKRKTMKMKRLANKNKAQLRHRMHSSYRK